ncbi:hypothetical protein E7X23_26415, partial [Bacteroides fragilis]
DGTPVATGLSGRAWRESGFDDSGSGACAVYDYEYWTAENLRTLTYPDGTPVATGLSGRAWRESGFDDSGSGACAVYDYE